MKIGASGFFKQLFGNGDAAVARPVKADLAPPAKPVGETAPRGLLDFFSLGGSSTDVGEMSDFSQLAPEYPPLTQADAREMEKDSGLLRRGSGVLQGVIALRTPERGNPTTIAMMPQEAVLVTRGRGGRAEISYAIDLPLSQARELVGKRVQVDASWDKNSGGSRGTARGARIVGAAQLVDVAPGDAVVVRGRVRQSMGAAVSIGGYREPLGNNLALDRPIYVGGQAVTSLHIEGGDSLSAWQLLELEGTLQSKKFGDNEVESLYLELGSLDALHQDDDDAPMRLDRGILENISGPIGFRVEGRGVLQGELCLREIDGETRPFLATFRLGAEKGFVLDIPLDQARELEGKTVQLGGVIRNGLDPVDSIRDAELRALLPDRLSVERGDRVRLTGIVQKRGHRPRTDRGEQADRPTRYLLLDDHVLVDGKRLQDFDLVGGDAIPVGAKISIEGKLRVDEQADGPGAIVSLDELGEIATAPEIDVFINDAEVMVNDFHHDAGPRLKVVVPIDQNFDD